LVAPKNEIGLPDIPRPFTVGIVSVLFVNPELWNAVLSILVTELGIVTDVNAAHESNALSSIVVTELGTVIDVNPEFENTL
jgi:hypothetical protein